MARRRDNHIAADRGCAGPRESHLLEPVSCLGRLDVGAALSRPFPVARIPSPALGTFCRGGARVSSSCDARRC